MVSRSLLALFALALFFAVASAAPAEEVVDIDDQDEERGFKEIALKAIEKAVKEVAKLLKKQVSKINQDCITEIYNGCDINPILHPKKYYKCAKTYFLEHKEHCYNSQ